MDVEACFALHTFVKDLILSLPLQSQYRKTLALVGMRTVSED